MLKEPQLNEPYSITQKELDLIANAGKKNFYFFCHDILGKGQGFEDIQEVPHREICNHAQTWNKDKKLTLTPRDSFKTTVLVVAYAIWEIIRNKNISILLTSDTMKNSIKSLATIKQVLEKHEFFRACYGDLVGEVPWSDTQICVKGRTISSRAYTIEASGADASLVGSHYNLILFDDPHNQKNINTPEQILKIIEYYKGLNPLLDSKNGRMSITATRWHHMDLENHILVEEKENFDIYIRAAYWEENGKIVYFFPNRLTPEFLEKRKKALGTFFFSCQYMNDPMDDESSTFKHSYFKSFIINGGNIIYKINEEDKEYVSVSRETLRFFVSIDPAGRGNLTEQRRLDYTGWVVVGVSHDNKWFIFEANRKKGLKPSNIIDIIFDLHVRYSPEVIGVEDVTWQGQLKEGTIRASAESGVWPRIRELQHNNRNKGQRIMGLQPIYESGFVYHVKGLYDLENELLKWSVNSTIHDDVIDSLAYIRDIAFKPDKTEVAKLGEFDPSKSPGFMIEAYEAWGKGSQTNSFRRFLEEYEPEDVEYEKVSIG
jgi:hypothetical protein